MKMKTKSILAALLLLAATYVQAALTAYDLRCELLHGKGFGHKGDTDPIKPVNITDISVSLKEIS